MDISIDNSEISTEQLDRLTDFARRNDLEHYVNEIGIDMEIPLLHVDEFYYIITHESQG